MLLSSSGTLVKNLLVDSRLSFESVPELNLHNDGAFSCQSEGSIESVPVLSVPSIKIICTGGEPLEGLNIARITAADRVSTVVGAAIYHLIEMFLDFGYLKEVVLPGSAEKQNGSFLVLPVPLVLVPGLNPVGLKVLAHSLFPVAMMRITANPA